MKRVLLAALLLAACAAPQVVSPEKSAEAQPQPSEKTERERPPTVIVEDGMRLEYRPHGRTVIEVTEPEGTQVQAFDGPALVAADTAPVERLHLGALGLGDLYDGAPVRAVLEAHAVL